MMTILTNYHLFLTLYTFILFSINIQFIFITPFYLHGSILAFGCRLWDTIEWINTSVEQCPGKTVSLQHSPEGTSRISQEPVNHRGDRSPSDGEMHHSKSHCNTKKTQ